MADTESLKQRLANTESKLGPLKAAADAAKQKADSARAAEDAARAQADVGSKFRATLAAKRAAEANPGDPAAQAAYQSARQTLKNAQNEVKPFTEAAEAAETERQQVSEPYLELDYQAGELEEAVAQSEQADIAAQVADGEANAAQAADPTSTIKSPEATNESATDAETAEKYDDPNNTPDDPGLDAFGGEGDPVDGTDPGLDAFGGEGDPVDAPPGENARGSKVPSGAQRSVPPAATAKWAGVNDLRVILRVNRHYIKGKASALSEIGGVLFPYTPQISYEVQANYGSVNPIHSNFTQYFYKHSQVTPITITGKFTVQNQKDGIIWLATQHLLRAITKMNFGKDTYAGSPPPVCRLDGFGDYQLANVPVAVQAFNFELTDSVDYIRIKSQFENTLVPTVSTLRLTLVPMYSRNEIQNYSVDNFITGSLAGKGFL